jgi:internalin A
MEEWVRDTIRRAKAERWTFLDLGNAGLTQFPEDLMDMDWLEHLFLGHFGFDGATGEGKLSRNWGPRNTILTLPASLGRLSRLAKLNLFGMEISDATPLSQLPELTTLDLGHNLVSDATPLSTLTKLTGLNLFGTNISDAEPIRHLRRLVWLDLGATPLTNLEPLRHLVKVIWLSLSYTNVSDIGPISDLPRLVHLDLSHTAVSTAEPLRHVDSLMVLDLGHCQLSHVPQSLLTLPHLQRLILYGNPIEPKEVLGKHSWANCLDAVRSHVADCKRGALLDRELKLIVLGNARVGKTSLIKRLVHKEFDPDECSTHGIRFKRWRFELTSGDALVNIWDFGGQDIYHGTHSLFLTGRAVFLVVWNSDTDFDPTSYHVEGRLRFEHLSLAYWLEYVRIVSPGSPVIVVQSKCDDGKGHAPPADMAGMPHVTFSAKTGHNRDVLLAYVQGVIESELVCRPAYTIGIGRWKVKLVIRGYQSADAFRQPAKRQHRTITLAHFLALCEHERETISSPMALLQYLHDTGVLYYHPRLFQGHIILDHRWVLDAIYCIYRGRAHSLLCGKHGRFTLRDLNDLCWGEAGYTEAEQRLFLSFMESCAMCFQIDVSQDGPQYIAPELLPALSAVQDEIDLRREISDDTLCVCVRTQYQFVHQGATRRLTARIGNMFRTKAVYWRDGLIFHSPMHRSVAQIGWCHRLTDNVTRGEYRLKVWGRGRHELLNVLRTELRRLHEEKMHICELASVEEGRRWIDIAKLPDANRIGHIVTQCGQIIDVAPFRFLLDRDERVLLGGLPHCKESEWAQANPQTLKWGDAVSLRHEELRRGDVSVPMLTALLPDEEQVLEWLDELNPSDWLECLKVYWCIGQADKEALLRCGEAMGFGQLTRAIENVVAKQYAVGELSLRYSSLRKNIQRMEDLFCHESCPAVWTEDERRPVVEVADEGAGVRKKKRAKGTPLFRRVTEEQGKKAWSEWTPRARKVWVFVCRYLERRGVMPRSETDIGEK